MKHNININTLSFCSLLLLLFQTSSHAAYTSTGFTSCNTGNDNVQNVFMNTKYGALAAGDMEFRLDGFCMHVENCTDTIIVGKEHELSLVTTRGGKFFKGFLWRLSGPSGVNTTGMMSLYPNSTDIQVSSSCINDQQVGGMTHTEDSNKTVVKAKFMIDQPVVDFLEFEITAVVLHEPGSSLEYYYNKFKACTAEAPPSASPPTPLPTSSPTGAPTPVPTPIPTLATPSPLSFLQPTNPDGGPCGDGTVGNGICANKTECCSRDGFCGTDDIHCNWGCGPCGDGKLGNGRCEDTSLCCSVYGWCGDSTEYCNGEPHPTPLPVPSTAPSGSPTPPPFAGGQPETPAPTEFCGGGEIRNGQCEEAGLCCSKWGYCGTGPEWCGPYCGNGSVGNGICLAEEDCCSPAGQCSPDFCVGTTPCGNGDVGNGVCADGSCCSPWGWCGTTPEFCGEGTPPPTPAPIVPSPTPDPTAAPFAGGQPETPAPTEFCGGGEIRNGQCEIAGECCSKWGYCGTGPEWCGPYCGNGIIGNGICVTEGDCCSPAGQCSPDFCADTKPCGDGDVGNGVCADGTCCSPWGWCGNTPEFCGEGTSPPTPAPIVGSQPDVTKGPTLPPTPDPMPSPTSFPTLPPFAAVEPGPTFAPSCSKSGKGKGGSSYDDGCYGGKKGGKKGSTRTRKEYRATKSHSKLREDRGGEEGGSSDSPGGRRRRGDDRVRGRLLRGNDE